MERPKEKMPFYRAVAMVSFAFIIDVLKFLFSTLVITGPLLIGAAVGAAISSYVGTTIGSLAGSAIAASSYLLEFATGGLGALGIAVIGEFFAIIIGFLGWGILMLWMTLSHISVFDTKISLKKISVVFGMGILNLIPIINVGAWLTAGVIYLVRVERKNDKERLLKYNQSLNNAAAQRSERSNIVNASLSRQNV